jgi:hypothetical protein
MTFIGVFGRVTQKHFRHTPSLLSDWRGKGFGWNADQAGFSNRVWRFWPCYF